MSVVRTAGRGDRGHQCLDGSGADKADRVK